MKITTYAQTLHDLNIIKDTGLDEVILGVRDFSRFGKLSAENYRIFVSRARELDLKIIFEWDILVSEAEFEPLTRKLKDFEFDVLRTQDPGVFEWALKNTKFLLHFIAENGNHNLVGLQTWTSYASSRLERIVLSIELPKEKIEEYCEKLKVPCELLGFGRILLFYTPRKLLSPLADDKVVINHEISALGESEESPHKGFPIVENMHGTFMFHIKEFCLIEHSFELAQMGLSFFRIDLRWHQDFHELKAINQLSTNFELQGFESFKQRYPQDLMKGFFLVNKTDVLFPKLKNHRLQKREGNYIGEVLEAEKGSHLAILVKNPRGLKKSDRLQIVHPEGKVFEINLHWLKNLSLNDVEEITAHKIALIPFMGGVWVKSHVFLIGD
jgi:putative protease